jgi:hypothetical protein
MKKLSVIEWIINQVITEQAANATLGRVGVVANETFSVALRTSLRHGLFGPVVQRPIVSSACMGTTEYLT